MLRFARGEHGRLIVDVAQSTGGRGAYLHRSPRCWFLFARRKGAVRSLGTVVDRSVRTALVESLQRSTEQRGTV